MAIDVFLKLDGITGEAQDSKHTDEIDILSWSWGMSQSGTTHMGGGGGSGKVSVRDLALTKYLDRSSPTLMQFCANGKHIATGTLTCRKAGGEDALEYLKIDFEEIIVSSVSTGGHGSEDRLMENLSLNFAKFTVTYTEQTAEGGAGTSPDMTWNIAKNKAE